MRQYKSIALTAIASAKNSDSKKIVIHGLDFDSPYFYEEQNIHSEKIKFIPPIYSLSRGKTVLCTAVTKSGVQQTISIIKHLLHQEGIDLLAASEK